MKWTPRKSKAALPFSNSKNLLCAAPSAASLTRSVDLLEADMARLALQNTEKLTDSNEQHQTKTKQMARDHNAKIQHLAQKLAEKKAAFERLQDEHDELFKRMKSEHEAQKTSLEKSLETKSEQLSSQLNLLKNQRKALDADFEQHERKLELRGVDDYLRMNWRNQKGLFTRGRRS